VVSSSASLRTCRFLVHILVSFKNTSISLIPICVCNKSLRVRGLTPTFSLIFFNSFFLCILNTLHSNKRCWGVSIKPQVHLLLSVILSLYKYDFKYPWPIFSWKKALASSLVVPKGIGILGIIFHGNMLL
jgi:hypothetical protein